MIRTKSSNKTKYFLGAFIIILMLGSGLAIFSSSNDELTYKGHRFSLQQGKYVTEIDGTPYFFDFLPTDVEDIPFESYAFNTNKVYISADNSSLVVVPKLEGVFVSNGVLPILQERNCSGGVVVLKLIDSDTESKIYIDQSCIILEGNPYKTSDRFAYSYLGIL